MGDMRKSDGGRRVLIVFRVRGAKGNGNFSREMWEMENKKRCGKKRVD